jgi:hypothetical protein
MRLTRLPRVVFVLLFVGCASGTTTIPVNYQLIDIPDEERIELTWRNDTSSTLCLLQEAWPSSGGMVYQGSNRVFLIVDGQRFPMEPSYWGYCSPPTACAVRVSPGEEVSASIPYRNFSLPIDLRYHPKTLEFSTIAVSCR